MTSSSTVQQAIFALRDPNFTRLALEWFANSGPFWDDTRAENQDDYFHFEGEDVTDQGLGEAARRRLLQIDASGLSFLNPSNTRFERSPLTIHHGLEEDPLGQIDIDNFWRIQDLEAAAIVPPSCWSELMASGVQDLDLLLFSEEILGQLRPYPFHSGVADRILTLLKILQNIAAETRTDGSLTPLGLDLYQTHFVGARASFTDESDGNKRLFENEMTFRDPNDESNWLFCSWHGKVKIQQFRIHFEWPRPALQQRIKITYIGPKITKR